MSSKLSSLQRSLDQATQPVRRLAEALERLQKQARFDDLIQAAREYFSEGAEGHDLFLLVDGVQDWEAARRMALRMPPGLANSEAREALKLIARDRRCLPRQLLRDCLLPAGLMLALRDIERPRHIRLGVKWLTDETGKKLRIAPIDLTPREFRAWLFKEVLAATAELLRGPREDSPSGLPTEIHGQPAETPLDALIAAESIFEQRKLLESLWSAASATQRQLLELLGRGLDLPIAATVLRMKDTTARVHLHRLRKKAHL